MKNALATAVGDRLLHHLLPLLRSLPEEMRSEARLLALEAAADSGWEEALPELLGREADEDLLAQCLHRVAARGLVDSVRRLLALGAPVNGTVLLSETPLSCAVDNGHTEVVRLLLAAGADPNFVLDDGELPPLCNVGSWLDDVEIVRLLLAAGADVNTEMGWHSPLGYAARDWDAHEEPLEAVRLLLAAGADPNASGGHDDDTPLHSAARHGFRQVVSLLLAHGAELDAENGNGCTALWLALSEQQEPVARVLLAAGADVSWLRGKTGAWLLTEAARSGALPTLRLLVELGVPPGAETGERGWGNAFVGAVRCNRFEALRYLLSLVREDEPARNCCLGAWYEALRGGRVELARLLLSHAACRPLLLRDTEGIRVAGKGHAGILRLMLEAGLSVEASDGAGRTLLMEAARHGHLELLRLLLARGARMEAQDACGWTPLMHAVCNFRDAAVELLLAHGADMAPVFAQPRTAQAWAVMQGDEAGLRRLLAVQEVDNFRRELHPLRTPLMEAVCRGHAGVVRLLLEAGAPARPYDEKHREPLHHAARLGHADCIPLLLAHGAQLNIPAEGTQLTPLLEAVQAGQSQAVLALLRGGASATERIWYRSPLAAAIESGHTEVVRLLLARGARGLRNNEERQSCLLRVAELGDVELLDLVLPRCRMHTPPEAGRVLTPLMAAASAGHAAVVSRLLSLGADVEAARDDGKTALMFAAAGGHAAVVLQLLAAGARVDGDVLWGRTALCEAARNGHPDVVELLLEHGAAVNAGLLTFAKTPLMLAAAEGHVNVVKALLRAGARVEVPFRLYGGPLAQAARGGHVEVMRLLLAAGADTEARGHFAETVLGDAAAAGQAGAVRLLLDHGANIETRRKDGKTPLHQAAAWGNAETVQLLLEAGANARALTPYGRDALWFAEAAQKQASAALLRAWLAAHPAETAEAEM